MERITALVAGAVLCCIAGCGGSSSAGDDGEQRIIPVNGDIAEVVYALDMGDRVVATDISATYPPAAGATPKIGYQRALGPETILSFDPTVVLADDLAGPPEVLDQLRTAGVDVVTIDRTHTIDEPAAKIRAVAAAIGVDGEPLAAEVQGEIDAAIEAAAGTRGRAPRVMAVYLRGESVQLVFGQESGVDAVIAAAGGADVGTEMGVEENAPLTAESIVEAAPDVILTSSSGLESVGGLDGLADLAGMGRTPAVRAGRVYAFEDQYLFGLGPRTGELIAELVPLFAAVDG